MLGARLGDSFLKCVPNWTIIPDYEKAVLVTRPDGKSDRITRFHYTYCTMFALGFQGGFGAGLFSAVYYVV